LPLLDLGWHEDCLRTDMPKLERVRDFMTMPPAADYFADKMADGWRLVAVEWERGAAQAGPPVEGIPFGLRVASDCRRLEESPDEVQVLLLMLEVLVQDGPLSLAAQRINERGYRTREESRGRAPLCFICCAAD